jgi:amino acid adenylation domain-containing protein/thioester reductase-like protein
MTTFPLTSAQMRMWFHHMLRPMDTAYNVVTALYFDYPLDRSVLLEVLRVLVNQNSMLRTGFRLLSNMPIASEESDPDLVSDIRWTERPMEQTNALKFVQRRCDFAERNPFVLTSGRPPVWFELIGRNSAVEGLVICQHHIVTDGWSTRLFCDQLSRLYDATRMGRSPPSKPAARFEDYARGEAGRDYSTALNYWRDALARAPTLDLPFARTRPSEQTFRGKSIYGAFDPETDDALHAYAGMAKTTPFTLQFSLVCALLGRLAEQDDFVIGTPYANRQSDTYHDVLGLFVNSIGLRQNLSGDPDFATLIKRARKTLSDALEFADTPIEKVVEALELPAAVSHNPLFQVLVANQSWAVKGPVFDGVPSQHVLPRSAATRFDLEWTFFPRELKRGFRLTWNTDIIADEHARALRELLIRVARQWLSAPETRLSEVELVSLAKAPDLIRDNPRPMDKASMTIAEAFSVQANETPHRIAVSSSRASYTYDEVERAAGHLSRVLATEANGRTIIIATLIDREPLLLAAMLAIFKARCVLVPLDPQQPSARRQMMIRDAKVDYVVVNGDTHDLDGAKPETGIIDVANIFADGTVAFRRRFPSEQSSLSADTAYILYTSGTTGRPKGVVVQHRNVMNTLLGAIEAFRFNAGDIFAVFAPVGFDIFFFELFSTLFVGGEAHLVSRDDWLNEEEMQRVFARATCLQAVPGLMTTLLDQIESYGPHKAMRQVTTGGDRVPSALLVRLARSFPNAEISVTYGPTEAAILASRHVVTESVTDYPIGQALPNVRLLIADEHGRLVPEGVEGELWIGGAGVAMGYLNRPQENEKRFVAAFGDRFYRTGDRCQWGLDGVLYFKGRRDSQIKIRGFRVELGEIEAKMAEHPCVRAAVATTLSTGTGDAKLLAYYVRESLPIHNQTTDEWNQIFDFIHENDESMFAGWHDSVERKPLPEEEMTQWHNATLSRLNALIDRKPNKELARILEIGCGTGLILLQMAAKCAKYNATDISPVLVDRLRRTCALRGFENCDIVIAQANESSFKGQIHDLVILNSVAQYFPSSDYLRVAISVAWQRVAENGVLFLGDLRSLALHDQFLHEVASAKAKRFASSTLGELLRLRAQENELLVHPAELAGLAKELPDFGGIHVSPKFAGMPNEVTRFRFDACIRRGRRVPAVPVLWVDNATWTLMEIEALATRSIDENRCFGIKAVPNHWTEEHAKQAEELNPAVVIQAARRAGAHCFLSWQSALPNGGFDVVFSPADEPYAIDFPESVVSAPLTNTPISLKNLDAEVASIRTHLKACMPTYMTPGLLIPIAEIPLTSHGKVDRAALPVSSNMRGDCDLDVPRTDAEKHVARIWQEILGLPELPYRQDNFFHLGGTSLTAIRLATKLRIDGFSLRPQMIFTNKTLAELSSVLTKLEAAGATRSTSNKHIQIEPVKETSAARKTEISWPGFAPGTRIMLTGATGFLGIHLLRELIGREGVEIICPVRASAGSDVSERLALVYQWYFGEELSLVSNGRVTTFPADLANGPLTWLASPVPCVPDMIIHTAADVRHLALENAIYRANVNGTEAVLSLAQLHNAAVHHISSIGVAGTWPHSTPSPTLRETDLDIGQELTEAYSESKFAAERLVRAFQAANGKAIVYRVGTIAPHSRTGRFQQRFDAHFLTRQIKACITLGAAPERRGRHLSLVPVDIIAGWIMLLGSTTGSNTTYHLHGKGELDYSAFYNMLRVLGYPIDILSDRAFKERLFEAMTDPKLHDSVGVFLKNLESEEMPAVPLNSALTFARLSQLGAKPFEVNQSWVESFIADAVMRGCLNAPTGK